MEDAVPKQHSRMKHYRKQPLNSFQPKRQDSIWKRVKKHRGLLALMIPGLIAFIIFNYVPMYGITLAFKEFQIRKGIMGSEWVGLKWFERIIQDPYMRVVLLNTLKISLLKLVIGFPVPILFALLLNEIRSVKYMKLVQTVSYLPNFISWVVLAGIFFSIFSVNGPINALVQMFGGKPRIFLSEQSSFVPILVFTDIWKGFGWGSIIYIASIAGIDPGLYEAARIDGASRLKCALHITLPCLVPVITIQLTLQIGGLLNAGFDQIFNMYNASVMRVADVIDTYVYRLGMINREYSYATAVGLMNSIVAILLIWIANRAAKAAGNNYTLW